MYKVIAVFFALIALVYSQQVGHQQSETHPQLSWSTCTGSGQCQQQQGSITLDSNWRWTHKVDDYHNCYTGNTWDQSLCPDPQTCATNCALDGADYPGTYGVDTSGNALTLKFVTVGQYDTNIGSRLYLLQDDENYQMFKLLGKEFTFDVDVSKLPCGLNGALYFVAMEQDGGMSKYPTNKCGAKYGTGYCDAQCPHDLKWINGEANVEDWVPSKNNPNTGTGKYGTCCIEMDIWESNSMASAVTPHVCTVQGQYRCSGTECGDIPNNRYGGVCDKDGCDFNPWRQGNKTFFGPGLTIDTTKPVTVVTQFVETGGELSEIKRIFVQNGVAYQNPYATYKGITQYNSITDEYCTATKQLFGDNPDFEKKGGLKAVGKALEQGMVLVMSLWDDYYAHMLWLDSDYPTDKPPTTPGVSRGPCSTSSGVPADVEKQYPNAYVKYSNIKFGDLNSTFTASVWK